MPCLSKNVKRILPKSRATSILSAATNWKNNKADKKKSAIASHSLSTRK